MENDKQNLVEFVIFPTVMSTALLSAWLGFTSFSLSPALSASLTVLVFGFILIPALERVFPYRDDWNKNDRDARTDIINLLVNIAVTTFEKPILVGLLITASAALSAKFGSSLWPSHLPLVTQLFLMLVIAEFGRYWIHFAAHKVPLLWRLHANHHSPNRLYFLNAARFHPIEKVLFQLPEVIPFILLGTNIETISMYLVFNTLHGLFQHSNIRIRLGILNYIFSMSELHRWHHSKNIDESDRNFGNNLIIWDIVFGTFFYPKGREVTEVGLNNPDYPKSYGGQLLAPFAKRDLSKPIAWSKSTGKKIYNDPD